MCRIGAILKLARRSRRAVLHSYFQGQINKRIYNRFGLQLMLVYLRFRQFELELK